MLQVAFLRAFAGRCSRARRGNGKRLSGAAGRRFSAKVEKRGGGKVPGGPQVRGPANPGKGAERPRRIFGGPLAAAI